MDVRGHFRELSLRITEAEKFHHQLKTREMENVAQAKPKSLRPREARYLHYSEAKSQRACWVSGTSPRVQRLENQEF
jgi:hypothetical protein